MLLIALHEIIHGLVWGMFAAGHFRSISFGFIWKALSPYCTRSEPLKKWQYILGILAPTFILGFGSAGIAVILSHPLRLILAEVMVLAGGGDVFIVLKTVRHKPKERDVLYYNHPYECGVIAFVRANSFPGSDNGSVHRTKMTGTAKHNLLWGPCARLATASSVRE